MTIKANSFTLVGWPQIYQLRISRLWTPMKAPSSLSCQSNAECGEATIMVVGRSRGWSFHLHLQLAPQRSNVDRPSNGDVNLVAAVHSFVCRALTMLITQLRSHYTHTHALARGCPLARLRYSARRRPFHIGHIGGCYT